MLTAYSLPRLLSEVRGKWRGLKDAAERSLLPRFRQYYEFLA
ncbi:hypothetical protein KIS4809_4262 [Bacillus sp. ZZV12-4809]|nr:hypothetical protein KIS4809_4262 [Bacillus sp. ZZV12-4809]